MPVEVIMPKVDMDMAQGTIAQWHKQEGDTVTQGDPLFDIETDKATMEVEAPASGILRQVSAGDGAQVDIGTCIAHIYADGEELIEPTKPASSVVHTLPLSSGQTPAESTHLAGHSSRDDEEIREDRQSDAGIRATPLARRIARQQGITLASVTGTGPRGRITRQDIELHGRAKSAEPLAVVPPSVASTERLDALGIDYTAQPVSRMRAAIADRLTLSKSSVPHFYLERDCQVDKLKSYRQDLNDALVSGDAARISLNDLVVQSAAKALMDVPEANVAWAGTQIIQYREAAVSVAVSVDDGLMTPVIRQAHLKTTQALSEELAGLATRARQGKLASHDCQGGSMSVTNLGMYGVQRFQAIINPPESMILAVGEASQRIIVGAQGQAETASVMSVCLSCDHRVIDGTVGARWLQAFQGYIENPVRLLL